MSNGEK
jgi:hypothetical protein